MKDQRTPVLRPSSTSARRGPTRHRVLSAAFLPACLILASFTTQHAWADAIFAPADQILGGQEDTGTSLFNVGVGAGAVGSNSWPDAEAPKFAIDELGQKYLNFGKTFTGILVAPSFNGGNGSVASSMQLWTANDAEGRDPSSYEIWGTNAALDFSSTSFNMSSFTQISTGLLTLPSTRNAGGAAALNNANSQTVSFANATGYSKYLIIFPTIKDTAANSMQIADIQLFGVAAFTSLKWSGTTSNIWNVNTTQNFTNGGNPSTYSDTNGVTFDDTASPTRTNITIQNGGAGVKPAVVIFQNNTLAYTINGEAIVSPGSLAFNGTGTVTLNNSNSFQSGTTVSGGTVNVGATGSLGAGSLTVNNLNAGAGTAVNLNFNSAQAVGSLSGGLATASSGANTATINLNGTLTVTQTTDASYAGVIAGTGGLTKEGASSLTLTGSSTYNGPTVINAGILRSSAPGDNAKGALPAGQPVTVNSGGTLVLGADDGLGYYEGRVSALTINGGQVLTAPNTHSTLPNLTMTGGTLTSSDLGNFSNGAVLNYILDGGVTTLASSATASISAATILLRNNPANTATTAPVTFTVGRGSAPTDLAISSVVMDQGAGLVKAGPGILALSNTNTYTGPTIINAGTVAVTNSAALGTGNVIIGTGTVLSLGAANNFNGFSGFTFNGGATADATNSTVSLTENVGSQARSVFSPTQVAINNGFIANFLYTAGGNRAADGITFTVQNSSPTALGGGGGGLGYVGIPSSAALELNLYTGGGQPVGTTFAVGTTGGYTASAPVNLASGDPIAVAVKYDPVALTLSETLTDLLTRATYSNTFTNVDIATSIGSSSGYVGFTGATGGAVASQSVGNFSFSNFAQGVSLANSISIPAAASAGIEVLAPSAGGAGTANLLGALSIANGGSLNVTGGATASNTPYSLNMQAATTIGGNATINVANNGTGKGTVVLGNVTDQATGATLAKTGSGTLIVSGAASYTGLTNVNAGALIVNGSIAGSVAVNNGGLLGGTGTTAGVMVATGGTLAPGTSIGTLNSGPLSLQNGSIFQLEIGTSTADQAKLAGGVTLTGLVNLALTLLGDPLDSTVFTIVDGSAAVAGVSGGARFSYLGTTLEQNQQFTVSSGGFTQIFQISYAADSGKDVTLLAIPEPGALGSLLIGTGAVLGMSRRRRQGVRS